MTPTTLTVTALNRQIRQWLEMDIGVVSVVGEISNLSRPASGHYYFTLKDSDAQLRCVYFKNYHSRDASSFQDGQQVVVEGQLTLYEARGEYQLKVQSLTPYGLGELYRQFERLKATLQQKGLFNAELKRPLPAYPERIAIITSPTGAALHDMLTTLKNRYPLARVDVYASEVQGKLASASLILALAHANRDARADVIVLARGGGSIEDLWAFNDEWLAYAIRESAIPVVSGVGHETDFTIADFVADHRAATPTAAAQSVTPDQHAIFRQLAVYNNRLHTAMQRLLGQAALKLSHCQARLSTPETLVQKHWQTLDYLQRRLNQKMHAILQHTQHHLAYQTRQLHVLNPQKQVMQHKHQWLAIQQRLRLAMQALFHQKQQQAKALMHTLHAVSPLATLDRGYAIATHHHQVLLNTQSLKKGDTLHVRLSKGQLGCEVLTIE